MTEYKTNYYRDTAEMTLGGTFGCHLNTEKLNEVTEAFTYVLKELKEGTVDVAKLNIVGDNAVKYAQNLLTQQKAVDSGQLRDSIGYKIVKTTSGEQSLEIFATAQGTPGGGSYGMYIEYGYHPWGRGAYISPRPYLRPALDFALTNTRKNIEDTLTDIFQNITDGKYRTYLHYEDSKQARMFGNRALATTSKARGTTNNKDYGAPTSQALSSIGSRFTNSAKYGRASYGTSHTNTRGFFKSDSQRSAYSRQKEYYPYHSGQYVKQVYTSSGNTRDNNDYDVHYK